MPFQEPGTLVMVMVSATQDRVILLGSAIVHSWGHNGNPMCPILKLHSGQYVPGCRCHWGSYEGFQNWVFQRFPFAQHITVPPSEEMIIPEDDPNLITDVVPKGQYLQ